MPTPELLAARTSRGLSQRALAARARDHQPTISALENGDHDPSVAHLSRLLAATGHRLVALPTTARPAYAAGAAIGAALGRGDESAAFREAVQLSDDLARESPSLLTALCALAPAPADPSVRRSASRHRGALPERRGTGVAVMGGRSKPDPDRALVCGRRAGPSWADREGHPASLCPAWRLSGRY